MVHADEAGSWDNLHERFEVKRINHQEAYSMDGACTNWAEEYFSRLRRAEVGVHHHIAGAYLLRYAQESSWREDNRRVPPSLKLNAYEVLPPRFSQTCTGRAEGESKIVPRRNRLRRGPDPATPLHDRDGVTRFQHRRKIRSILIRNTVVPTAIRTTLGNCLALEGVKSPKTRSLYEYHPPGRSKTVRTAVGRSIFPADGIGRTSKPAAGEGGPAGRRARQEQIAPDAVRLQL